MKKKKYFVTLTPDGDGRLEEEKKTFLKEIKNSTYINKYYNIIVNNSLSETAMLIRQMYFKQ
jgi:hypothetical protein